MYARKTRHSVCASMQSTVGHHFFALFRVATCTLCPFRPPCLLFSVFSPFCSPPPLDLFCVAVVVVCSLRPAFSCLVSCLCWFHYRRKREKKHRRVVKGTLVKLSLTHYPTRRGNTDRQQQGKKEREKDEGERKRTKERV